MGKWKGGAPLSNKGDWTHGPLLQLKYNSHSKAKVKIADDVVKRIGSAYDTAIEMLDISIAVTKEAKSGNFRAVDDGMMTIEMYFTQYFGKNPDLDTILSTLVETLSGLKSTDKSNRVYLFDAESKPEPKNKEDGGHTTVGYVSKYALTAKDKKQRPVVKNYRRGHIHINYTEKDQMNMASTIIHEGTHRFAGTGDFAYSDEQKFQSLQAHEQLNNADSYAAFCRAVWMRLL